MSVSYFVRITAGTVDFIVKNTKLNLNDKTKLVFKNKCFDQMIQIYT